MATCLLLELSFEDALDSLWNLLSSAYLQWTLLCVSSRCLHKNSDQILSENHCTWSQKRSFKRRLKFWVLRGPRKKMFLKLEQRTCPVFVIQTQALPRHVRSPCSTLWWSWHACAAVGVLAELLTLHSHRVGMGLKDVCHGEPCWYSAGAVGFCCHFCFLFTFSFLVWKETELIKGSLGCPYSTGSRHAQPAVSWDKGFQYQGCVSLQHVKHGVGMSTDCLYI